MRYQFVTEQEREHSVARLCQALGISRSGYYQWRRQPRRVRAQANARLLAEIRVIHRQYDRRYGSPRMAKELCARELPCGEHRVARLMRQAAKAALFEYIEMFYNRVRRHSTLGQLSPMQFEQLRT